MNSRIIGTVTHKANWQRYKGEKGYEQYSYKGYLIAHENGPHCLKIKNGNVTLEHNNINNTIHIKEFEPFTDSDTDKLVITEINGWKIINYPKECFRLKHNICGV